MPRLAHPPQYTTIGWLSPREMAAVGLQTKEVMVRSWGNTLYQLLQQPPHLPEAYHSIRLEPKTVSSASVLARSGLPPLFCMQRVKGMSVAFTRTRQWVAEEEESFSRQHSILTKPSLSEEGSGKVVRSRKHAPASPGWVISLYCSSSCTPEI